MRDQNQTDPVILGLSLDEKFLVLLESKQKYHFLKSIVLCKQAETNTREAITNFREKKQSKC